MQPRAYLDRVTFYETGYKRDGHKFRPYREGSAIILFGRRVKTHRAIGLAKMTPAQRDRQRRYDIHHLDRSQPLTWSSIQVLGVETHRNPKTHKHK